VNVNTEMVISKETCLCVSYYNWGFRAKDALELHGKLRVDKPQKVLQ